MRRHRRACAEPHFCTSAASRPDRAADRPGCHVAIRSLPLGTDPTRTAQRALCAGLLVDALRCHGHTAPASVRVDHDASGAPTLSSATGVVSIAHDGRWCAVALAHDWDGVGIDIQVPRKVSMTMLRRLAPDLVPRHGDEATYVEFARRWTSREAVSKALGTGLRAEMVRTPLPVARAGWDFGARFRSLGVGPVAAVSLAWTE